jgi:hypothetical protein
LAAVVRVGWVARASRERPRGWQFCTYLVLVGAQAALVCAMTRCEPLGYGHMRYMLLALLPAVGIVALYLGTERLRLLAAAMIGTVLVWAGVNLRAHVALLTEYTRRPPLGNYRTVATYLESHGIRYARADYWAAYHITFLSDERVIVAADSPKRIDEYERVVSAHEDSAVRISRSPCPGGTEVGTLYICAPGS